MITNYLPKFKTFEVNNLTGLRNGHMLSQVKAAADITVKTVGEAKFVENGLIVGLGVNEGHELEVQNFNKTTHGTMFVHYTEELNTFLPDLEYFAVEQVKGEDTYIRCIALYVGDTFTTNNYTGTYATAKYAKVGATGVLELQTTADADTAFKAVPTTMPNGAEGVEFTFYRMPTVA